MTDRRVPTKRERRQPHARFRCTVCSRFVVATEFGVCPHCGLGPPGLLEPVAELDVEAWSRARKQAHQLGIGSSYWISAILTAVLLALIAAVAVGC